MCPKDCVMSLINWSLYEQFADGTSAKLKLIEMRGLLPKRFSENLGFIGTCVSQKILWDTHVISESLYFSAVDEYPLF